MGSMAEGVLRLINDTIVPGGRVLYSWRGAWDAETQYSRYDAVSFEVGEEESPLMALAIEDSFGDDPTTGNEWFTVTLESAPIMLSSDATTDSPADAEVPAPSGSFFLFNHHEDSPGSCWIKTGEEPADWTELGGVASFLQGDDGEVNEFGTAQGATVVANDGNGTNGGSAAMQGGSTNHGGGSAGGSVTMQGGEGQGGSDGGDAGVFPGNGATPGVLRLLDGGVPGLGLGDRPEISAQVGEVDVAAFNALVSALASLGLVMIP